MKCPVCGWADVGKVCPRCGTDLEALEAQAALVLQEVKAAGA